MKKLRNKINAGLLAAKLAATNFIKEERGDTNFISIAIILIVVIIIAVVFIAFGKQIVEALKTSIAELMAALGM